jgi:hypothetical protein
MRCRPGDIAVIVRQFGAVDYSDAIGRIVRVLTVKSPGYWNLESPVVIRAGAFVTVCDDCLRPLRPDEGTDETMTWAGKPQESVRDALEAIRKELA